MDLYLPEYVYHGTNSYALEKILEGDLIKSKYWRNNRDFGKGFYTTTNLSQAKDFAYRKSRLEPGSIPCVLKISCNSISVDNVKSLFFIGYSFRWARTIYDFRIRKLEYDTELFYAPLADNKINRVVAECNDENQDIPWFYDKIVTNQNGKLRENPGEQLVFCNETIAKDILSLSGWYKTSSNRRWEYYDKKKVKSI